MNLGKALCHKKALKIMIKMGIQENDWYFLCDADEFYTNSQKKSLKKTLANTKKDYIKIHDRMFAYNFQYYRDGIHGRFYRFKKGMRFAWYGQQPLYKNGNYYKNESNTEALKDNPMFHYSFVKITDREMKRRKMEVKGGRRTKDIYRWIEKIYLKWTEEKAENIYRKNKKLFGTYGWFYKENKTLKKYTGPHPKILDNHPYRHVKDMRNVKEKIVTTP